MGAWSPGPALSTSSPSFLEARRERGPGHTWPRTFPVAISAPPKLASGFSVVQDVLTTESVCVCVAGDGLRGVCITGLVNPSFGCLFILLAKNEQDSLLSLRAPTPRPRHLSWDLGGGGDGGFCLCSSWLRQGNLVFSSSKLMGPQAWKGAAGGAQAAWRCGEISRAPVMPGVVGTHVWK